MLTHVNDSSVRISGHLMSLLKSRTRHLLGDATDKSKDLLASFIKYSYLYSGYMAELFPRLIYPFS